MSRCSPPRGFTLIELAIVIAIIGFLAAIVYPGYTRQIVRSNRADAQQALIRMAQQAERVYTQRGSYVGSEELEAGLSSLISESEQRGIYGFAATVEDGGLSFSIMATPIPGERNEGDGALEIRSDGSKILDGSKSWAHP